MKRVLVFSILALFLTGFTSGSVFSNEMSNSELTQKIKEIEDKISSGAGIRLSGALEFEYGYEKQDDSGSDFSTATVDLGAEGKVNDYITGSFVFTYNDEDGDIELDEAIIAIAPENSSLYANLGYFSVPFGNFNSRFLSDSITELGETTENNITAGFKNDMFNVSATLFNGDVNEAGEDDDHITKFVVAGSLNLPENEMASVSLGGSLISDIADSDGFEDILEGEEVKDFTMGYSVYVTAEIMKKFFFDAEYLAAADEVEYGAAKIEPKLYNIEFGFAPVEKIEGAVRYESGDDVEVDSRYGAVVSWAVLDNTTITGEYLRSEPEDSEEDDTDTFTAQIAVEF